MWLHVPGYKKWALHSTGRQCGQHHALAHPIIGTSGHLSLCPAQLWAPEVRAWLAVPGSQHLLSAEYKQAQKVLLPCWQMSEDMHAQGSGASCLWARLRGAGEREMACARACFLWPAASPCCPPCQWPRDWNVADLAGAPLGLTEGYSEARAPFRFSPARAQLGSMVSFPHRELGVPDVSLLGLEGGLFPGGGQGSCLSPCF